MAASGPSATVDANLSLTIEGQECAIWSESDLLVVTVPPVTAARRLLPGAEQLPVGIDTLLPGLETAGVTVEVRLRHAPVARFGAGVDRTRLAALAGYDGRVSLRGAAVGLYRRLLSV